MAEAYIPTSDEKNCALATLWYEMREFSRHLERLGSGIYDPEMKNPLIESMLIHVRALLEFFQTERRKEKSWRQKLSVRGAGRLVCSLICPRRQQQWRDAISEDFGFKRRKVPVPKETKDRINVEVAHISYFRIERIELAKKEWKFKDFLPLVDTCIEFIDGLSDEQTRECAQFLAHKKLDPRPWPILRGLLAQLQEGKKQPAAPRRSASSSATGVNGGQR